MKLVIDHLDGALPSGVATPLAVDLVRRVAVPGGAYWLGRMPAAVMLDDAGQVRRADHVIIDRLPSAADTAPFQLGWVTDPRALDAAAPDFAEVRFVATGAGRIEDEGDDDGGMEAYA